MTIETERLTISPAKESDIPTLHRLFNLPEIQKYNCMVDMTVEKVAKRFAEGEYRFCLYTKDTGTLIGTIGEEADDLRHGIDSVCLSYELDPAYQRKGYMTEALNAYLAYAFREKKVANVTIRIFGGNEPSLHLVNRLGFVHEGTLRQAILAPSGIVYDDCVFAMQRAEYETKYGK